MSTGGGRAWTRLAIISWVFLGTYLVATFFLVAKYQPKVVLERDGTRTQGLPGPLGSRLYEQLTSIWAYNRYVIPGLVLLALALTFLAWRGARNYSVSTRH